MFLLFNIIGQTITDLGLAPFVVEIVKFLDILLCGMGLIG